MQPSKAFNLLLLIFILLTYVIIQSQLPHETFWSNDGGEKSIQVAALLANKGLNPEIHYDRLGIETTASFEFAPLYPGHARILNKRLIPNVPVYFPLLSSFFYKLFGHVGLFLLPALSSLLTLFILDRLCRDLLENRSAMLAVLAAGLGSPVFFYSLTFWEHSSAMFLVMAALYLIYPATGRQFPKRRDVFFAGVLLAVGASLRGDIYFIIAAVAGGLVIVRDYRRTAVFFASGVILGLVPFAVINYHLYGIYSGPQMPLAEIVDGAASLGLIEVIRQRWEIVSYLIVAYVKQFWVSLLFFLTSMLPVVLFNLNRKQQAGQDIAVLLWTGTLLLISLGTFGHLFFLREPMIDTLMILGLFAVVPILPFAFVWPGNRPRETRDIFCCFLTIVMLLSLVGFCLGLPSRGGLQWGPRYAIGLLPVLIILAVRGQILMRERFAGAGMKRLFSGFFVLLIVAGILIQGFGISLLAAKKEASRENIRKIELMAPQAVITDTWWVPEDNAELFNKIPFYSFYTYARLTDLIDRLAAAGAGRVVLVSTVDYREILSGIKGWRLTEFDITEHDRLKTFNLYLHAIEPELAVTAPWADSRPPSRSLSGMILR